MKYTVRSVCRPAWYLVAALLVVVFYQCIPASRVEGQTVAGEKENILMATSTYNTSTACWIYDKDKEKLVVYILDGGALRGLIARKCTYDFMLDCFPPQAKGSKTMPTPAEVRKMVQDAIAGGKPRGKRT